MLPKSSRKLQFGGALISSPVNMQTWQTRPGRQAVTVAPPPLLLGCAWGTERPGEEGWPTWLPAGTTPGPGVSPGTASGSVTRRGLPMGPSA